MNSGTNHLPSGQSPDDGDWMTGKQELPPAISVKEFEALAEMVGQDMPEILVDIIDTYIEEATELVFTAATLKISGESLEAIRAVHSLKSSSASLGAMRLSNLCAELEDYFRDASGDLVVEQQVDEIQAEFDRVCIALEAEKGRLANT